MAAARMSRSKCRQQPDEFEIADIAVIAGTAVISFNRSISAIPAITSSTCR